ncbi:YdiU family protein [Nodosilinea sp. LEGE 07088]|uniref:protein adenylyltransferase SelO n=1 Tax=Nodosilinea sp. LEGE 07088 TaxID=2777968 RepID=UPI0018816B3C|nr:YdiU family protein [Nodosilinea sp. LEGE 07088]MBE9140576.1 YdiU family protein [Nodosilinea sp. LEGE 07088]
MVAPNPFLTLAYEPALAALGDEFYDRVQPACFPNPQLRYRNDPLLPLLGLAPAAVSDRHFEAAFGHFQFESSSPPPLALRYHGYQFGQYNPYLGDGRGFLYGQVRSNRQQLLDLGTKGSGQTPHAQGRDGRLSLLGGIREVLAAEALHGLGIPTSRILCLVETGETLTRDDHPTPARGAVMVRLSRSHIRFGTFERLEYLDRPDLVRKLLDHVIQHYYSHLWQQPHQDIRFYTELVQCTACLVARWMAAGFCHGVLNTDNMSITGEGFDYGPYAFIDTYSPYFTPATFDRWGRYSYRNQPSICRWNLAQLQRPLALVIPQGAMETALEAFMPTYDRAYRRAMVQKLGFDSLPDRDAEALINLTLQFLFSTQVGYHRFFQELQRQFSVTWRESPTAVFPNPSFLQSEEKVIALRAWRNLYHQLLRQQPVTNMAAITQCLRRSTPTTTLSTAVLAEVWGAIATADDWYPFHTLINSLNDRAHTNEVSGREHRYWDSLAREKIDTQN